MRKLTDLWQVYRVFAVELFCWFNLTFLTFDILYAHSMNKFGHWAEYIPLIFSILAGMILLPSIVQTYRQETIREGYHYWAGFWMGWLSFLVGFSGFIFHLHSSFFEQMTMQSLVYAAPFVAPLAYAGIGLLLLLNRNLPPDSKEWGRWITFLALGGFAGNFVLSVTDHAQNGFFYVTEWIPVVTSALVTGFLLTVVVINADRKFYNICFGVLAIQFLVGILGFFFHILGNITDPSSDIVTSFIYGAPAFAPLLFPNLAILGVFGVWDLYLKRDDSSIARNPV